MKNKLHSFLNKINKRLSKKKKIYIVIGCLFFAVFVYLSYPTIKSVIALTLGIGGNVNLCTTDVTQPPCYSTAFATPQLNWTFTSGTSENSDGDGFVAGGGDDDTPCGGAACLSAIQSEYQVRVCSNALCGAPVYESIWISSAATSHTVPSGNLSLSTDYYFGVRVKAHPPGFPGISYITETDYTATQAFTTNAICAPGVGGSGIGENLVVNVTDCDEADFSWDDNCTIETSFTVEKYNIDTGGPWQNVCVVVAGVESCNNQTLLDGVHWKFRLKTSNGVGEAYDAEVLANTEICAPTAVLATTIDCTKVRLNWTDNSLNENNYLTRWSSDGIVWNPMNPNLVGNITQRTVWQPVNSSRRYQVSASNNAGFQSAWIPAGGVVGTTLSYCSPDNLTITSFNCDCVNLSWTMVGSTASITKYDVYRKINNGAWSDIADVVNTATTYSDCNIVSNTEQLEYYIVAQNIGFVSNTVSQSGICVKLPIWKESR